MPSAIVLTLCLLGQTTPDVIVHAIDGPKPVSHLLGIDADFSVRLGGKKAIRVEGADLVALRQVGVPQSQIAAPYLRLTSGDVLPLTNARSLRLDDDVLHASLGQPIENGKFSVPLAAASGMTLVGPERPIGKQQGDVVILKTGDRLEGKINGIDEAGVTITVDERKVVFPFDRVIQLAFDPEFQSRPRLKSPRAEVMLTGGGRLVANQLTSGAGNQLTAVSPLGQQYTFAASNLAGLRMRTPKIAYLDEMKPKATEFTPFLDVTWPLATGHARSHKALRLGDDIVPYGLAMHSRSQVTFEVQPGDAWLEAAVGIDPESGAGAAVKIDVLRDGKSVPSVARLLQYGEAPTPLRVSLDGAKSFTLVTDFGPRGDVRGQAIWGDARILRK